MEDINFDSFEPVTLESEKPNPLDFNTISGVESSNKMDSLNMDMFLGNSNINNEINDEEQKRINDRKREAEERQEKINKKMQNEQILRDEIRRKASEYLVEFEQKRQEEIAISKENLEKNSIQNNNGGGESTDSWSKVKDNIDLKDSEYKGSKDVQRMREAMLNKKNGPETAPIQSFFG